MTGATFHIPTLETDRLRLRAARWDDFPAYAAFRGDAERTRYLGGPFSEIQAFDQLGEILGHWILRGYGRWMLADKDTDAPLGIVGPYYPAGWPEPEIAWAVFAGAEGRGLALEAARASRDWAYETLGWTTAISLISDGNQRSMTLAANLGCTPEGRFTHEELGSMQIWRHPGPGDLA